MNTKRVVDVERSEFGGVRVEMSLVGPDGKPSFAYQVNGGVRSDGGRGVRWPSLGAVTPEGAREFALLLLAMADEVDRQGDLLDAAKAAARKDGAK